MEIRTLMLIFLKKGTWNANKCEQKHNNAREPPHLPEKI